MKHQTETMTESVESRQNSSGTSSQDWIPCSSATKSKNLLYRLGETPVNFTGRIIFMLMFNDISWRSKDNKKESESRAQLVSLCKDLEQDNGHFSVLVQRKSGTLSVQIVHKVNDGDTRRKRTPSLPCHESIVQRSAQKQRWWTIRNTLLCRPGHDYNCFSHHYFCKSAQSLRSNRRNV